MDYRLYLVLRVSPRDINFVDTRQDAIYALEAELGVRLREDVSSLPQKGVARFVFRDVEGQLMLAEVLDIENDVRYLEVGSPSPEMTRRVGEWLIQHLPVVPLEELQDEARLHMQDDPHALVRMALGSSADRHSEDKQGLEILERGLRDEDELVRYYAAMAAVFAGWASLTPTLRTLSREDPDEDVRRMANHALDTCVPEDAAKGRR